MIEAYSENDWGIMLGKRNGLNQSILLREIEIIVNRISKVFGNIGFEYQPFQLETEGKQLKEDNSSFHNEIGKAERICESMFDNISFGRTIC